MNRSRPLTESPTPVMNQLLKRGDKPQREPSSAQQSQRTDPVKAARIILKRDRLGSAMIHITECVEILKRVSFIAGQRSDSMKALDLIDGQKMSA